MTSIAGIGYSPLGTMGLGMSGQYGSYDAYMPSMMGMGYGMGMTNPMFGMGGMMGAYPQFMAQMQQAQNQIEISQAQHNGAMHRILMDNQVAAHNETDSALMRKMLRNGDIQQGVQNLYDKVQEGDQDGICAEFDKLKNYVYNTYRDELAAQGNKINPAVSATQYIEMIYGNMATAWAGDGKTHSLRDDIIEHGDGSFSNGFMSGLRRGHHSRYVDETLNYCFGQGIDQKESKDMKQTVGNGVGRAASVLEKGAYGLAAGVGVAGVGTGLAKLVTFGHVPWLKTMGKVWKPAAAIGALAGMAADIWWQTSKA